MGQIPNASPINSIPDFNGSYVAPDGTRYSGVKQGNTFRGAIMRPDGTAFSGDINGSIATGSGTPPVPVSSASLPAATTTNRTPTEDRVSLTPLAASNSAPVQGSTLAAIMQALLNPLLKMVDR